MNLNRNFELTLGKNSELRMPSTRTRDESDFFYTVLG